MPLICFYSKMMTLLYKGWFLLYHSSGASGSDARRTKQIRSNVQAGSCEKAADVTPETAGVTMR